MPLEKAFMPAITPHPDPPGQTAEFTLAVEQASNTQVKEFLAFREVAEGVNPKETATEEACKYRGELFDKKIEQWEWEKFGERKAGLKFPIPMRHWNGWAGWWAVIGPRRRAMVTGHICVFIQHIVCGLVLPLNQLFGKTFGMPLGGSDLNFKLAMYGDIGANIVDLFTIAISGITGRNRCVMQLNRALWPLMIMHHVSAIGMEATAMALGSVCPPELACKLIISLLGTTGAAHNVVVPAIYTPFYDSPTVMLGFQTAVFGSMCWYRGIYWLFLTYRCMATSYAYSGGTCVATGCSMLLFTLFNQDFIAFHWKVLTIQQARRNKSMKEA